MFDNHQQVSNLRPRTRASDPDQPSPRPPAPLRDDPFARLVRQVHNDARNPFNIERYHWVLEEPPAQPCGWCGVLFDPWFDYAGDAARGLPRRYCSPLCRNRAAWARRCSRAATSTLVAAA